MVRLRKAVAVSLIAIGDELLNGSVQDTNSTFIASFLLAHGLTLNRIEVVKDDLGAIEKSICHAALDSDFIVTTGGLGPTSDDCTRQAVASWLGVPLEQNLESLSRLSEFFTKKGRTLNAANIKQTYFPRGSTILINPVGTADAFVVHKEGVSLATLPGVPHELRVICETELSSWIKGSFGDLLVQPHRYIKIFGLSESYIATKIDALSLPELVTISYRPKFPEVLVTLRAETQEVLEQQWLRVRGAIGAPSVFSLNRDESMAEVVVALLTKDKVRLALAESCTGGLIASELVSVPGASLVLDAGVVAYSNESKEEFLGVSRITLAQHGAVSKEAAIELAVNVRNRSGGTIGLSITGIAGPQGGTKDKPVGTFWIGLATAERAEAYFCYYPAERNAFRKYAATRALDLLRRYLLGYELLPEVL